MTFAKYQAKFWARTKRLKSGCLIWTGHVGTHFGYGLVKRDGRRLMAHRAAWELLNGPIPPGLCVLHRCDNPPCVNTAHLFLGSKADNARDMIAKRRQAVGERCRKKLTAVQVQEIRSKLRGKYGEYANLARQYGVTPANVRFIAERRIWKHL